MSSGTVKESLRAEGKNVNWYRSNLESVQEPARRLLETYSGVPPEEVVSHILAVRDRGFEVWPYPCLGKLNFLDLSMSQSRLYPEILERLKRSKQTLFDLGCCFAQDIRKLVSDGVPGENLYGLELRQSFVDLGYELFRDKESLKATFIVGNSLEEVPPSGLEALRGKVDIVYAGSVLHLFPLDEQIRLARLIVSLLRPVPGSLILGRQRGSTEPGEYEHRTDENKTMYRHNPESFRQMWQDVGKERGIEWDWTAWMVAEEDFGDPLNAEDRRLYFEIRAKSFAS